MFARTGVCVPGAHHDETFACNLAECAHDAPVLEREESDDVCCITNDEALTLATVGLDLDRSGYSNAVPAKYNNIFSAGNSI